MSRPHESPDCRCAACVAYDQETDAMWIRFEQGIANSMRFAYEALYGRISNDDDAP